MVFGMQKVIEQTSYIVNLYRFPEERREALLDILSALRQSFSLLEIIVIEQDIAPKFSADPALNIRHVFISNTGLYNHSLGINEGAKNSHRKYLVFANPDIFMDQTEFTTCLQEFEHFEVVIPNQVELTNVSLTNTGDFDFEQSSKEQLNNIPKGILFFQKNAFERIGGCDERLKDERLCYEVLIHVIGQKTISKTLYVPVYSVDFVKNNPQEDLHLKKQELLVEEVLTFSGPSIERYCQFLKRKNTFLEKYIYPPKKPKFILAITTYNRLSYLQECVNSFLLTRNGKLDWQLIIADDGSIDGTKEYLAQLQKSSNCIIIHNNQCGITRQTNTILKQLSELDFSCCFKADDDIVFTQKGWDDLYWGTIQRTGYDHLVFYDKKWRPYQNLDQPFRAGGLIASCPNMAIQGGFYTLTKRVLQEVGYFDERLFGTHGLEHVDYSFRCCRAGFNVLKTPFDVLNSNEYLQLQPAENYHRSVSSTRVMDSNSESILAKKLKAIGQNRTYVPYNENESNNLDITEKKTSGSRTENDPKKPKKADATFYADRSIIGFLLKRFYNLMINLGLYFVATGIKKTGKFLNKLSIDLMNIDE